MNRYKIALNQKKEAIVRSLSESKARAVNGSAESVYRDKTFREQFYTLYNASRFLNILCMTFSFATMTSLLFYLLSDTFSFIPYPIIIFVSLFCAVLVEIFKKNSSSNFFVDVLKDGEAPFFIIIPFLLSTVISLSGAYFGAITLPSVYEKLAPYPALSETNEHIETLKTSIEKVDEDILLYRERLQKKWDRYIQTTLIPSAILQRNALQSELDNAIVEINKSNDLQRNAFIEKRNARVKDISIYILYGGLCMEVLFVLSSMFMYFYLFNVYIESDINSEKKK